MNDDLGHSGKPPLGAKDVGHLLPQPAFSAEQQPNPWVWTYCIDGRCGKCSRCSARARWERRQRRLGSMPDFPNKLNTRCRDSKCGECRVCLDNARWERIFKEKFAYPEYYSSRPLHPGSSLNGAHGIPTRRLRKRSEM
jgi:hypothetical protein